jgi:hypothetical protein
MSETLPISVVRDNYAIVLSALPPLATHEIKDVVDDAVQLDASGLHCHVIFPSNVVWIRPIPGFLKAPSGEPRSIIIVGDFVQARASLSPSITKFVLCLLIAVFATPVGSRVSYPLQREVCSRLVRGDHHRFKRTFKLVAACFLPFPNKPQPRDDSVERLEDVLHHGNTSASPAEPMILPVWMTPRSRLLFDKRRNLQRRIPVIF